MFIITLKKNNLIIIIIFFIYKYSEIYLYDNVLVFIVEVIYYSVRVF